MVADADGNYNVGIVQKPFSAEVLEGEQIHAGICPFVPSQTKEEISFVICNSSFAALRGSRSTAKAERDCEALVKWMK